MTVLSFEIDVTGARPNRGRNCLPKAEKRMRARFFKGIHKKLPGVQAGPGLKLVFFNDVANFVDRGKERGIDREHGPS